MRKFSHQTKSQRKRETYYKAVKAVDYEPTVDDSLAFPVSDDRKPDYSTSTEPRTRPQKLSMRISEHVKENWIAWLVGAIGILLVFFVFNFNRDMGKMEGKMEGLTTSVNEVKSDVKHLNDKIHSQDLDIQKNQIEINTLRSKK